MTVQQSVIGVAAMAALLLHTVAARAQDPPRFPSDPPIANPIDPAALNAPPAFGDSGPVAKPDATISTVNSHAISNSPGDQGTTWIPKLRVVLVTSVSEQTAVTVDTYSSNENTFFTPDNPQPVVRKTTIMVNRPSEQSVVLTCDDVHVEASSGENGDVTYRFSCKGKAMLTFHGYTVTGDSISSSEGELAIKNAVIQNDQVTMTSENLVMQLPIFGVQVGATNPSDFLKPIPDVIGGAAQPSKPVREESVRFEDDKPYDRGPIKSTTTPQATPQRSDSLQ